MRFPIFLLPGIALAANLVTNPGFHETTPNQPSGWATWSPRPEIAPEFRVVHGGGGNLLRVHSKRFAEYGKWISSATPVSAGTFYRFDVEYRSSDVDREEVSVAAMLSWNSAGTHKVVQRDYIDRVGPGEWRRMARTIQAPTNAASATIELIFRWSEKGAVEWRSPSLIAVDAPRSRKVRIATTHITPASPATIEANLRKMTALIDSAGRQRADIICLSEDLVERGVDLPLEIKAHPIPGPITQALGEAARRNRVWVVTALVEREGDVIYNTAVLLDREGRLAAKYRKVHLPTSEAEDGMTPGSSYQVFATDFGRIGLLVCWDNWFVEPARLLRLQGAEMLLFPLAGDAPDHWDLMSRARAVDNGLYIVSSNTVGGNSRIVDPSGAVLAEVSGPDGLAVAEVDLNREWRTPWLSIGPGLGEAKSLYLMERRPETYSGIAK